MLESTKKIKQQTIYVYDMLEMVDSQVSYASIRQIQQMKLFKECVNIIFAVLANFTAPINKKLNALKFLKKLFQTAHPEIISEAERIIPVLVDIVMSPEIEAGSESDSGLYFVLKELRPVNEVQKSRMYVRFAMQIIKQWAQYMTDIKQFNTVYITQFKFCQDHVSFHPYFLYFTMKDYIQFMTNWLKRKKQNNNLEDKIKIYYFLTNSNSYSRNLQFYITNLTQNANALAQQIFSILINHTIPVEAKLQTLIALKDLYQQGNFIFSQKINQRIPSYFIYLINILDKDFTIERYFQIIEKRFGIDYNYSMQYVFTLLQLAYQWDIYNSEKVDNPFVQIAKRIKNRKYLNGITTPLFQGNDIIKYNQNMMIAKHREHQYIIPQENKQLSNAKMKQKLNEYQRMFNDFMKRQKQYQQRIDFLSKSSPIKQLNNNESNINKMISDNFTLLQEKPFAIKHIVSQDFPLPFKNPNQDEQFQVVVHTTNKKIRQNQLLSKQKQLIQKMQKNKLISSRNNLVNQKISNKFEDIFKIKTGPRKLSQSRANIHQDDLFKLPDQPHYPIRKLSDAIKHKQRQLSASRFHTPRR